MDPQFAKLLPYLGPLLIVALVAWRLFKNPPRKVKPNRLFIRPLVLLLLTGITISQSPAPGALWFLVYVLAAAVGSGVGYLSGMHREFTLNSDTGEIVSRATPIGTILFAALFAIRYGLKLAFPQLNAGQTYGTAMAASHPAAGVIVWTEAGLVFSTAMIVATSVTMWLRTRHLVRQRVPPPKVAQSNPPV